MVITSSWIIFVSLLTISFFGIVIFSKIFCKPIDDIKFSFMRVFPFEVEKHVINSKAYRTIIYLFICLCFSSLFVLTNINNNLSYISSILIVGSVVLGLASICFLFLHVFDVTHVKTHLAVFTILLSLILLCNTLLVIYGLTANKLLAEHSKPSLLLYLSACLAGILCVLTLLIALNPKLMVWAKLDKVEGSEDQYVRPKKFPLAYSEWALFLLLYLSEIILFLEMTVQ